MNEREFSNKLQKFFEAGVHSVEQLEIILLLSGNPHRWWSAGMVYDVIKSNIASVTQRLEEFTQRGILKKEAGAMIAYRFLPESEDVWDIVSELRDAYKERPVKVIQAIYSRRSDPIEEFAKAFKLKREK